MNIMTKPGRHGTLRLYAVHYRDSHDKACPIFVQRYWAYSAEHAEEKFWDSDNEGWTTLSIERVAR